MLQLDSVELMSNSVIVLAYIHKQGRTTSAALYLLMKQALMWTESHSSLISSKVHSRLSKCGCRPAKPSRSGDWDQMVPSSSGDKGDALSLGDSSGGFVHLCSEQDASNIKHTLPRPHCMAGVCLPSPMGCLCISIIHPDSEDPQQSVDILKSQTDFGRALLAAGGLDPDLLALIVDTLRSLPS